MERRWVVLFSGLILVSILATFGLGYFYVGFSVSSLFYGFLFVLLSFGIMTFLFGSVLKVTEKILWLRRVSLDDDRQQKVSVDYSLMKSKLKITRELTENLYPRLKNRDSWFAFLYLGIMVVVIVISRSYPIDSYPGIITGLVILFVVVVFGFIRYLKLYEIKMRCLLALLNHRCGSCLYELQGQIPEADGCVVCPECGGAWRLDRCPKCATKLELGKKDLCPVCGWNRPVNSEAESEPAR